MYFKFKWEVSPLPHLALRDSIMSSGLNQILGQDKVDVQYYIKNMITKLFDENKDEWCDKINEVLGTVKFQKLL